MKKISNKLDEKYRPSILNDMIGNEQHIATLKNMVANKNIPHLLFSGPAGTGKTSAGGAIVNELFGKNKKGNYREWNASEANGIEVIRTDVKDFAKYASNAVLLDQDIPFKIIILDECDNITAAAQAALRRIMEKYADRCRFILMCNYPEKLIDPLISRCTHLKFKPIMPIDIINRAKKICDLEHINITDEALKFIVKQTNGDMRKTLGVLELARVQALDKDTKLDVEFFKGITISQDTYKQFLLKCMNRKIKEAYDQLINIMKDGVELKNIVVELSNMAVNSEKIPDGLKAEILDVGMQVEEAINNGCAPINAAMGYVGRLIKVANRFVKRKETKPTNKKSLVKKHE